MLVLYSSSFSISIKRNQDIQFHFVGLGTTMIITAGILKVDFFFFLRGQNLSCAQKSLKNHIKSHKISVNHEEKTVKEVKMQKNLVCVYKSQDFAQSQEKCARSHNHETVKFRNSASLRRKL